MNVKINKEESDYLLTKAAVKYVVGSKLYGTDTEKSDTDVLVLYNSFHINFDVTLVPTHQLQYDDLEANTQYLFTSTTQYVQNLFKGESTINADVVLFEDSATIDSKLMILRSFKIIKAYLGFAKRDIKQLEKKLFHVRRGLHTAECLLNSTIVEKSNLLRFDELYPSKDVEFYLNLEKTLRFRLSEQHAKGLISDYNSKMMVQNFLESKSDIEKSIINKLMGSMNIREFKY